jgi:SAM-dependent methyltransferase
MADYYERFAADYDWIFDDDALAHGLAINHPATARLLARTSPASVVLDAACGTGVNAAALAHRGYRVWACDASEAMIAVAADRFRAERLEIPLVHSTWTDLPAHVSERFDVVLCIGNSLVHAGDRDAMIDALTALREMVRPGGRVLVDSRNWEKLHAERRIVQLAERAVIRNGQRCVVLYAWEIPDRLDQEHVAHIVLIFEDGDRIEPREYRIGFRPFTVNELRERLKAAGLTEVDTDFDEARDRYAITATR